MPSVRGWTPEEEKRLLDLIAAGKSWTLIGGMLKRSSPSRRRGNSSSMVEIRSNRWTSREDDLFQTMAEANTRPEVIAAKLNRSVHAIKARAYTIGLPLKWFKLKAKRN
jgi:Myb-like DNA-binding domain